MTRAALAAALLLAGASPAARADDARPAPARDPVAALSAPTEAERLRALEELPAVLARDPRAGPRALPVLRALLRTGSWQERAGAVRALPQVPGPEGTAVWLARLDPEREEDERVLAAAVDAARARAADAALVGTLVAVVRDARAPSGRRALALEALGGMDGLLAEGVTSSPPPAADATVEGGRALALGRRGGRGAIAPLLDLLGHADPSPRAHAWESLTRITGLRMPAERAPWAAWWAAHEKEPLPDPAASRPEERSRYRGSPAHVPRYYGLPIEGHVPHVVFCLDTSQSMYGSGIERAKRELTATLKSLPTACSFEVVAFAEGVRPFAGRLVRAHPVVKARALAWIDALETLSYTNLYDAVEAAFEHAGRGRHPSPDPTRLDAVYLLSDGAPNRGRYHVPEKVVEGIAALSAGRVPVHTIGAGDSVFPLLRAISTATGGTFVDAFE